MTSATLLPKNEDTELRKAILEFDKSRGQTGADYVLGKITRQQAAVQFEDDIAKLIAAAHAHDTKMLGYILGEEKPHYEDDFLTIGDKAFSNATINKIIDTENALLRTQRQRAKQWLSSTTKEKL